MCSATGRASKRLWQSVPGQVPSDHIYGQQTGLHCNKHTNATRRTLRGKNQLDFNQPVASVDYNYYMGGVDKQDQLIKPYDIMRKTQKWTQKLGFHFLQVATLNAHTAARKRSYKRNYPDFLKEMEDCRVDLRYCNPLSRLHQTSTTTSSFSQRHTIQDLSLPLPANWSLTDDAESAPRMDSLVIHDTSANSAFPLTPTLCVEEGCFELHHTKVKYWTDKQ